MNMIGINARRYDWATWMLGIFRSFISGGSAAMVAGLTTMGIAPGTFNLSSSIGNTLKLMGVMFLFQGGYRMFEYLQLHGAPDQLQATLDAAASSAAKTQEMAVKTAQAVAKAQDIAPEAAPKL
jgi:hypothetical protein